MESPDQIAEACQERAVNAGCVCQHLWRAEVAKLEAAAEAYLSANVPSIPTLSRLQDLEAFYGMGHAIPTRPLPSHRKLPFSQVCIFEIRMRLFRKHVELLS